MRELSSVLCFSLLFATEGNVSPALLMSAPDSLDDRPQHNSGKSMLMWQ